LDRVEKIQECSFGFAFDVAATGAAVAVGGGEVLTGHGVEDEDGAFEAAVAVGAQIAGGDVAATEVDEEGFSPVMQAAVGEDIADVIEGQIPLRQTSPSMLGYHGYSWFAHLPGPPTRFGSTFLSFAVLVSIDLL
jgi:hypothetical protein